jgi:hypothetical protein
MDLSGYADVVAETAANAIADIRLASGINHAIESGAGNNANG